MLGQEDWNGQSMDFVVDTFVDGLPIRAAKSTEVGTDCYNGIAFTPQSSWRKIFPSVKTMKPLSLLLGWGHSNYIPVDPVQTYEFSIWIRASEHNTDVDAYFGKSC